LPQKRRSKNTLDEALTCIATRVHAEVGIFGINAGTDDESMDTKLWRIALVRNNARLGVYW